MEITRQNFAESFPSIKDAIDECDYVAIDTELTGLYDKVTDNAFDTMAERYAKQRENCLPFLIVQFGISTFKYHAKENKYTHKDFNIYIFPRSHIRKAPDHRFLCQTSSLHFLASNGFDFNKVIYDGVSYLKPSQEEEIRSYLSEKHQDEQNALLTSKTTSNANGKKSVDVPDEHKDFIAKINKQVDAFIANENETVIKLDPCSSYLRKLIYETVQQKHQSGIEMSSMKNSDNHIFITIVKCSDEEKAAKLNSKQIMDVEELEAAVGFRKVMDLISQSKKLVVGHNMILDLMHTINQFYFPLPEDLKEFKQMARELFPRIADTKMLASSEKLRPFFESTHLMELGRQLRGKAFDELKVEVADGFEGYELNSEKAHEAGYDAFMTGYCYAALTKKLGSLQSPPVQHVPISSKLLSPLINRLFVMKHYDISTLNLSGPDPEPDRANVFYVSFPPQWKTVDLVELFLPFGNIYVSWLNDVSALVALRNRDHIINAKTCLLKKTSKVYTVKTYADYQKMCMPASNKTSAAALNNESAHKKRNSIITAEEMDLIPEGDENEADKADDSVSTSLESSSAQKSKASPSTAPSAKRLRQCNEDGEVTSTAPVFEEENDW
ncbi:poly(A)-specific ribonuclease PARN-like [Uloborus diversus]|uniref:poly(A)-specific ribonuclease PARN-like n=1 Tax=Uloborus diversus TaxID=327109 RepID=UPI00240978F7|nr:poly(A)-specific ribonuclease PARN-like [Uloborus diversus]